MAKYKQQYMIPTRANEGGSCPWYKRIHVHSKKLVKVAKMMTSILGQIKASAREHRRREKNRSDCTTGADEFVIRPQQKCLSDETRTEEGSSIPELSWQIMNEDRGHRSAGFDDDDGRDGVVFREIIVGQRWVGDVDDDMRVCVLGTDQDDHQTSSQHSR